MDELFRQLADHVDEGVFVIRDRVFIYANPALARMLGRHLEDVIGLPFSEVVAPEDLDMVADRYRRRWAGESVPSEYEFRLLGSDGETRIPVRLWVTKGQYEAAPAIMGVVRQLCSANSPE